LKLKKKGSDGVREGKIDGKIPYQKVNLSLALFAGLLFTMKKSPANGVRVTKGIKKESTFGEENESSFKNGLSGGKEEGGKFSDFWLGWVVGRRGAPESYK